MRAARSTPRRPALGFGRDIGMVLGDAALALRPALAWEIDNDKRMMTHGEIVIGPGSDAPKGLCPVAINALGAGVHQLWQVVHTGRVFKRPNAFSFALDVANGGYERFAEIG